MSQKLHDSRDYTVGLETRNNDLIEANEQLHTKIGKSKRDGFANPKKFLSQLGLRASNQMKRVAINLRQNYKKVKF